MLLPVVRQREQAAYKLSDKLTKRCAILQNDEKWRTLSSARCPKTTLLRSSTAFKSGNGKTQYGFMHRQKTHRQIFKMIYGTLVMESGMVVDSKQSVCPDCSMRLLGKTLYDRYRERHLYCDRCGTVLAADARFCPPTAGSHCT